MLQLRINSRRMWTSVFVGNKQERDKNGDYTGRLIPEYSEPVMFRGNLSPSRGTVRDDIFGESLQYSKTLSVTNMDIGINEQSILWDEKPVLDANGKADPKTAKYRVAAIARGHYHIHYALRQMNAEDGE